VFGLRKLSHVLALIGATACLSLPPRFAAAQTVENPEALIRQGHNRRVLGDNQGAYRLFMRAYNARRTPKAAAHLGSCEFEIGLWVEAEAHITEALRAENDPWIQQKWDELSQIMASLRQVLGRLEVVGRPAGADVEVAGRNVGRLPLEGPLRVVKGEVVVRVTGPGYKPFQRTVKVAANELTQVVVELDRDSGSDPGLGPQVSGRTPYPGPVGGATSEPLLDSGPTQPDWRVPAGWASAGVATLLAIGGGVSYLVSYTNTKHFNDYRMAPFTSNKQCNQSAPREAGGGPCSGWLSTAQTARTLAIASGVGAGVAALAAVIFFSTADSPGDRRAQAQQRLACAGTSCTFRF
jgi:hypothetical protein